MKAIKVRNNLKRVISFFIEMMNKMNGQIIKQYILGMIKVILFMQGNIL